MAISLNLSMWVRANSFQSIKWLTSSRRIAGIKLKRSYKLNAPKGVRGRSSDNTLINRQVQMSGAQDLSLEVGLEKTYRWIFDQIVTAERLQQVASR